MCGPAPPRPCRDSTGLRPLRRGGGVIVKGRKRQRPRPALLQRGAARRFRPGRADTVGAVRRLALALALAPAAAPFEMRRAADTIPERDLPTSRPACNWSSAGRAGNANPPGSSVASREQCLLGGTTEPIFSQLQFFLFPLLHKKKRNTTHTHKKKNRFIKQNYHVASFSE